MELVHGTPKLSKSASEDAFSSMPEDVITNILDRLPLQDAVGTSILSRNWRFKWTTLTQLIFDEKLYYYLRRKKDGDYYNERNLSRLFLHLKGPITKFVLYIPPTDGLDAADFNHWVRFVSKKGIEEFTLINKSRPRVYLPTHLFSCLGLKHLKLHGCCFRPMPSFCGFPSLLSIDLFLVTFAGYTQGELISQCPLLENLKIRYHLPTGDVKLVDIAKLENLKVLSLSLCVLENMARISSSSLFRVIGSLPKLQELDLGFLMYKSLAEVGAGKRVPTRLPCLKTLTLNHIDFSSDIMVSWVFELICGSPNLQTLKIRATYKNAVQPAICSPEVDCCRIGQLQLQDVSLAPIRGSENEVCFIKFLLACSPLLEKMVIRPLCTESGGDREKLMFARKLLKLYRASPVAEIDLDDFYGPFRAWSET